MAEFFENLTDEIRKNLPRNIQIRDSRGGLSIVPSTGEQFKIGQIYIGNDSHGHILMIKTSVNIWKYGNDRDVTTNRVFDLENPETCVEKIAEAIVEMAKTR